MYPDINIIIKSTTYPLFLIVPHPPPHSIRDVKWFTIEGNLLGTVLHHFRTQSKVGRVQIETSMIRWTWLSTESKLALKPRSKKKKEDILRNFPAANNFFSS